MSAILVWSQLEATYLGRESSLSHLCLSFFVDLVFLAQPDPNEVVVKSTQSVDYYADKAFNLLNVRSPFPFPFLKGDLGSKRDATRPDSPFFYPALGPLLPLHHPPSQISRRHSEGSPHRRSYEAVEAYEVAGGEGRGGDSTVSFSVSPLPRLLRRFSLGDSYSYSYSLLTNSSLLLVRLGLVQIRCRGEIFAFSRRSSSSSCQLQLHLLNSLETQTSSRHQLE